MRIAKIALPAAILLVGVFTAGWMFGVRGTGESEAGVLVPTHFKCYSIPGNNPSHVVNLQNQFGVEVGVSVERAVLLCTPTFKQVIPGTGKVFPYTGDHLKCYNITPTHDPDVVVTLRNQFGVERNKPVGQARLLCVPTQKIVVAPTPTPTPIR